MRHPCAVFSNQRERGFSECCAHREPFLTQPPAQSHQPPSPLPQRHVACRRSPHPAANRFVQEAFLIGFAMRKALSFSGDEPGRPPRLIGRIRRDGRPACLPGFFSGSTEFNDIGGQVAMRDGALPRFDRSELLHTIGQFSQKSCRRGIFHDWARPSVQVVCGLGEGTREENIPSCNSGERLAIRGSSIDWPSSGPYGRERGRFRRG